MAQLSVDLTGYYESMIKGQWSFDDAFNEQPHNTFDNGGTRIDLSFYNKETKKLTIEKDEKDNEFIKNPHIMVYQDNCRDYLKDPEKIMATLADKVKHKGVGNFNLGEIGSIFNLGTGCIYITPTSSFEIKENMNGLPELVYLSDNQQKGYLAQYNLTPPKIGTMKLFILKPDEWIFIDDLKRVAEKTSLAIFINGERLPSYGFNYNKLPKDYHYKNSLTVYGSWNNSNKSIDFYMKEERIGVGGNHVCFYRMKNDIERFPTQPGTVAKEYKKYFYDKEYLEQTVKDNADLCLTFKTSLYPFGEEKVRPKGLNEQGMIHLFQNVNSWVILHSQNECEKFAEYTIPYYSRKSKVNGVWRGLESISHFSLEKTTWKKEILEEMGFFPIKSKGKNLYECRSFRNISRIIYEKQIYHFGKVRKTDGGGDKWDNITVDKNNVWRDSKNEVMEEKTCTIQGHTRVLINRDDVIHSLEYLEQKMNDYGLTSTESIILSESIQNAFYSNALGIKSEDVDCMVEEKPSEIIQKVKYWYLKKYKKNIKARGGSEIKRIENLERSKGTT